MMKNPPTGEILALHSAEIKRFVKCLNDPSSERLLFFYGQAGTGKSSLLRFLLKYCCKKYDQAEWATLSKLPDEEFVAQVQLADSGEPILAALIDFGMPSRGYDRPVDSFYGLLMLRRAFAALSFPRFDFAFVWYLHKTKSLTDEQLNKLFPAENMHSLSAIAEILRVGSFDFLTQTLLNPLSSEFGNRIKAYAQQRKLDASTLEAIKQMTPESGLINDLPRLFAEDLKLALEASGAAEGVALFFDTHEAFWGAHERELSEPLFSQRDEWLRRLLTELEINGSEKATAEEKRIVSVVAGSEIPRWTTANKVKLPVEKFTHLVDYLSEIEAARYLERSGITEEPLRRAIIDCARIAFLPRIHPLHLGLCVDAVRVARAKATALKPENFAALTSVPDKTSALVDLLLAQLDPVVVLALKLLSVCRAFDSNTYNELRAVSKPLLPESAFSTLTQLSFVSRLEMNGQFWYRIHELVRSRLSDLASNEALTRRADEAMQRYYAILGHQIGSAEEVESIYHLNRLDWEIGVRDWVRGFEIALREQTHDRLRQWLAVRAALRVEPGFWQGRICQAAGDYFTELKRPDERSDEATQEYEYALSAYDAVLKEKPDLLDVLINKEHVLLRLDKLTILKLKSWRLEAVDYPVFKKQKSAATSPANESNGVQRFRDDSSSSESNRLVEQICYLQGSYLVTGYRGVGKTSFVNYALHKAAEKLRSQERPALLIPVILSVANYTDDIEKLLIRTIRSLYQAVLNSGHFWDLPSEIRDELSVASKKTLYKVSQSTKDSRKETFGMSDALATTWSTEVSGEGGLRFLSKIGGKIGGSRSRTITQTRSEEQAKEFMNALEYLSYDREIAEAQLIKLIQQLGEVEFENRDAPSKTTRRRFPLFWKLAGKLLRKSYLETPPQARKSKLHLVFVFDEMDKVSLERVKTLLPSIKELLLTSKATFIFIGGEVIASDWLGRERPEGDPSYGIFADMIYVPLLSDEEFKSLAQQMVRDEGTEFPEDLLNHLILHSYGTPREFFRQILRYVIWQDGNPALKIPLSLTRQRTYSEVYPAIKNVNAKIPNGLPNEIRDYLKRYVDEWLIMVERAGDGGFEYLDRLKSIGETTDRFGGYWSQVAKDHFARFFTEMSDAKVIMKMEGITPERFKFSSQFTLGQLRHLGGIAALQDAGASTVGVGSLQQTTEIREEAPSRAVTEGAPIRVPDTSGATAIVQEPVALRPEPPLLPTTFVGRISEQQVIADALEKNAVVQVVGMPGSGKTTLARAVANSLRDRYVEGVVWIDVDETTTPESILRKIAASLNYQFQGAEALESQIRSFLSSKKALIVINGAELFTTVAIVGNKNSPTLITSRRRFATLEALGPVIQLEKLSGDEGVALLQQVMGQFQSPDLLRSALDVGRLLDNNPLALDIAARWARDGGMNAKLLSERLQQSDNLLELLKLPLAETTDVSILLSYAKSYEKLSEWEKKIFRATSVFESSFDAAAVAEVLGALDKVQLVEETLAILSEVSLITRSAETYSLHLLLRTYAKNLAKDNQELSELKRRHQAYFLRKIEGNKF